MDFIREVVAPIAFIAALIVGAVFVVYGVPNLLWGARKVEELRKEAPAFLDRSGFTIVAHEGFTYGLLSQPGGCVWYLMHRKGEPGTVYNGCVAKWHDDTYEIWQMRAVNAIEGGKR